MAGTSDLINLELLTDYDALLKEHIDETTTNASGASLVTQIDTALAACRTACA